MKSEQGKLFNLKDVNSRQFNPVSFLVQGANRYAARRGYTLDHEKAAHARVKGPDTWETAERYNAAPNFDPEAIPSFEAMRSEVAEQYKYLTNPRTAGGLGVNVSVTDEDPYKDVYELADDIRDNRQLKVMSTRKTGGHPFFTDEENDQFRAVHDAFGHAGSGRDFARDGEEGAYLTHAQMFSEEARPALEMETRGQNSYLNAYGKGFGEQKVALLKKPEPRKQIMQQAAQGSFF